MSQPTRVFFPSFNLNLCGELHAPQGDIDRKGAAIVVGHPTTGVKEQTASDYARALAKAGFYALTFDAGYQGESSGEPRGFEDPHQRIEDIKSAVTYLSTAKNLQGKVDPQRIGALGICASGGYSSYATQSDCRIKALATVSAVCVGRWSRNGTLHEKEQESPEAIAGILQASSQWRNACVEKTPSETEVPVLFDVDPAKITPETDPLFRDASEYYGTSRGKHPRSTQCVPPSSFDLMISYDSFNFQHLISPRPLLMIAGSKAQTLHFSKVGVELAREPKELVIVDGKNHFDLYDDLTVTGPKVVDFFEKALTKA